MSATAAVILFGALAASPGLKENVASILQELATRGFQVPSAESPVKLYPAESLDSFYSQHAALWWPGLIYLRPSPKSDFNHLIYLRHELMHEASYRTCRGRLKNWEEEAHALLFSGEVNSAETNSLKDSDVSQLSTTLRYDRKLTTTDYATLRALLSEQTLSLKPCQTVALKGLTGSAATAVDGVVMHLKSGRVYDYHGDIRSEEPLGSLLKVAMTAAITTDVKDTQQIAQTLLKSDSREMSRYCKNLNAEQWRLLTRSELMDCPTMMGFSDLNGRFKIRRSLLEAARIMRASFLARWDLLKHLEQNGQDKLSTLNKSSAALRSILTQYNVVSKTGTVGNSKGLPLIGYATYVWPAADPTYIAVVKQKGVAGYHAADHSLPLLSSWLKTLDGRTADARVQIMSKLNRPMWSITSPCGLLHTRGFEVEGVYSPCGTLEVRTSARNAKPLRILHGVFSERPILYQTDALTYAEGVLASELAEAKGSAADALKTVAIYNVTMAPTRHTKAAHVCDTTHCMVYQGDHASDLPLSNLAQYVHLQTLVRRITQSPTQEKPSWLSFSLGGDAPWQASIARERIAKFLGVPFVVDLRRIRQRDGSVIISYQYADGEGTVSCEIFRNALKLRSCPDKIDDAIGGEFIKISGHGEGHGLGLNLLSAMDAWRSGISSEGILAHAYRL